MNARDLPWILVAILSIVTACNYTDGPCWRRDQGGIDGPGGVGGSVGGPGGVGGYGDTPPDPRGAPVCNAPDETSDPKPPDEGTPQPGDETALLQHDLDNDFGAGGVICADPIGCLNKCNLESKYCGAERAVHPQRPPLIGDLYQCIDTLPPAKWGGSYTCLYRFPDDSACIFAHAAKLGPIHIPAPPPLCVYKTK